MRASNDLGEGRRLRSFLGCFERSPVANSEELEPASVRREGSPFTLSRFRKKQKARPAEIVLPEEMISLEAEPIAEVPIKTNVTAGMKNRFLLKKIIKALFSRHQDNAPNAFPQEKTKKKKLRPPPPPANPLPAISVTDLPQREPPPPLRSPSPHPGGASASSAAVFSGDGNSRPASPCVAAMSHILTAVSRGKKNNDQLLALSILAIVMIMMLLFGRLSAIFCTSVWLYVIPRLRADANEAREGTKATELDLDSDEYKKRVVLEGLLRRNGRQTGGYSQPLQPLQPLETARSG